MLDKVWDTYRNLFDGVVLGMGFAFLLCSLFCLVSLIIISIRAVIGVKSRGAEYRNDRQTGKERRHNDNTN